MLIKRIIILFFFLFFLSFPKISLAEETTTQSSSTISSEETTGFLSGFFQLISNIFAPKYEIDPSRTPAQIRSDLSNFGDVNSKEYKEKQKGAADRLTSNNTQNCLRCNVIKEAVLNPRKDEIIGKICLTGINSQTCRFAKKSESTSNCTDIKISNLAYYLLQNQTQIYCNENDQKITTEDNIVNAIYTLNPTPIPSVELPCYQGVYDNFFLTEQNPDNPDEEKNTIKIMKTPLPARYQNTGDKVTDLKKQNEFNFSSQRDIDNNKASLNNLRPAAEQ